MNSEVAVALDGVTKSFAAHSPRLLLSGHFARWGRGLHRERFVALRNVGFRLRRGESMAVLGPNGAGKSTLLGVVVGLTRPDSGEIIVNGRVAPLLEIGSGFHLDLTAAENLRLNASLLGLTRKRTAELFDRIVDFAGVGDFIDEPLRTYSAGMVMRLAFSVAINTDPDILVIDEVLAVGDQAFQAKCFEKIIGLKRAGRTILCASHSPDMVQRLCERAILLDQGEVIVDSSVQAALEVYEGRLHSERRLCSPASSPGEVTL